MIEIIRTYTGASRNSDGKGHHLRMVVAYAYRCTKCGRIFPNHEEAEHHVRSETRKAHKGEGDR